MSLCITYFDQYCSFNVSSLTVQYVMNNRIQGIIMFKININNSTACRNIKGMFHFRLKKDFLDNTNLIL